jgi:hypothetical protein
MGTGAPSGRQRIARRILIGTAITLAGLAIVAEVVLQRAAPILKGRIEETLSARFNSRVELGNLQASVLRGLQVTGDRLAIYPPDEVVAAGARKPLIAVQHFSFRSGVLGLFFKPMHVGSVYVTGLQIAIPPKEYRQKAPSTNQHHKGKMKIVVDEIVCEQSSLIIETAKPDKDPKHFELKHIRLQNVGPNDPWRYRAELTNAVPKGAIFSEGHFGPWDTSDPGKSPVDGHYRFNHADLGTIKGIGGILSSTGKFGGQLDRIVIDGTTETPDFSLDTADRPVPLHTEFHAIVDGTSGDTYLQPVRARLLETDFTTSGAVINIKGVGHRIELDVDVPAGRIQDFLDLAVKTQPPVMTGVIATKTKLTIRPGRESVTHKLATDGQFTLRSIHFSNPSVQDKVDGLSLRARGRPKESKPGAKDVISQMRGRFTLSGGALRFSELRYALPGAIINLAGVYSLDGQQFQFRGKVHTQAKLSHMVGSKLGSAFLKLADPFFRGDGGGAEIPVSISGTKSKPKFGLDLFHRGNQTSSLR